MGFPGGSEVQNLPAKTRDVGSVPELGRSRKWHPPSVLLPGKSHGQRILVGYSQEGHRTKFSVVLLLFKFIFYFWPHDLWDLTSLTGD